MKPEAVLGLGWAGLGGGTRERTGVARRIKVDQALTSTTHAPANAYWLGLRTAPTTLMKRRGIDT